jgi:hypothetical protein
VQTPVRVPVILPDGVDAVTVREIGGETVRASLINQKPLSGGGSSAELLFVTQLAAGERKTYGVDAAQASKAAQPVKQLSNRWLDLQLSSENGVDALIFEGQQIGGAEFLDPFITYKDGKRNRIWDTKGYEFADLTGEAWDGLTGRACWLKFQWTRPKVAI